MIQIDLRVEPRLKELKRGRFGGGRVFGFHF
jgi:hypothetical protein